MAANPPPGWLCHICAKSSGADPFKKPAAPRKRKAGGDKRTLVSYEERRFPSLASVCIQVRHALADTGFLRLTVLQVISNHIDDVEALGDIGTMNMDEIAKALSNNRSLCVLHLRALLLHLIRPPQKCGKCDALLQCRKRTPDIVRRHQCVLSFVKTLQRSLFP